MQTIATLSFLIVLTKIAIGNGNGLNQSVVDQCVGLLGTVTGLQDMMRNTQFVKGGRHLKTRGSVWPQPQQQQSRDNLLVVLSNNFSFKTIDRSCDILDSAFERYQMLIFNPPRFDNTREESRVDSWTEHEKYAGVLQSLEVSLSNPCLEEWPTADMDEKYDLKVNTEDLPGKALLTAESIWGILRGLETFSQLIYTASDGTLLLNGTTIHDYPRFPYRGLLLDTSRHYLSKKTIFKTLETMAQNKFNVFHWHMVDNPSFPYQSERFPNISKEGAFDPRTHIYTLQDVRDVINFARLRGIRVIPEFDTPGHTLSWGLGIPGLLTPCYKNVNGTMQSNGFGPIDPTKESNFEFLKEFYTEILDLFPDSTIHLGGDEVFHECWQSNPDVVQFMKEKGFGTDFSKLEAYFIERLQDMLESMPKNSSYIVWEEAVAMGSNLRPDTIVQVWKTPFYESLSAATKKGNPTILSSCWYLNYVSYGTDWYGSYLCDPQFFFGNEDQMKLILGGEVCMWGEFVDGTNLEPTLWPRASAPAERLWSDSSVNDMEAAAPRLEEHRCRMITRGTNAQPQNGPGFCNDDILV